mmetsp:Transcript_4916/g.10275  ORF Transcript_4916/g.10275 Transcript_4916/m.10275 type:complete len:520 (-) Transcript_4916:363-1922(-)
MAKEKKRSKKQLLSKERSLEKKRKKKEKKRSKEKNNNKSDEVAVEHEKEDPTINESNTASTKGAIPIKLSAGIDPTPASAGWSWGAAFAAADTIRPDEKELDDDFLSRAAEADAAASSGWGKGGIVNISQLASSHVTKASTEKPKDVSGRKRKKSESSASHVTKASTEKPKDVSGRKRKKSESSTESNNHGSDDDDDNNSIASINSSESVLEGRTAVLPGDDETNITMVLVDKQSGLVYSSGERTNEGKRLQIGKTAGGSIEFDTNAIEEMKRLESGDNGPSFPYKTDEDDHCETPLQAYADIQSILDALCKSMGKSKSSLKIYDPYFCNGSVVNHLKSLGYTNVYNKKEDCYAVWETQGEPTFDVFITNPPYSADHIDKLMTYITSTKFGTKPWLLLMPNWVHKKDYYENSTTKNQINASYPFYIVPKKRYVYVPPPDFREKKASDVHKKSSPFVSMWYVWGGTSQKNDALMQAFQRSDAVSVCDVARSKSALRDLRRNGSSSGGGKSSSKKKKRKTK